MGGIGMLGQSTIHCQARQDPLVPAAHSPSASGP